MRENQKAKDELRLNQCARFMRAIVGTFGEPIVLDALAVILENPDGKSLLSAAAECSREVQRIEQGPTSPPGLILEDFQI